MQHYVTLKLGLNNNSIHIMIILLTLAFSNDRNLTGQRSIKSFEQLIIMSYKNLAGQVSVKKQCISDHKFSEKKSTFVKSLNSTNIIQECQTNTLSMKIQLSYSENLTETKPVKNSLQIIIVIRKSNIYNKLY